jgi:FO synthase subunit 1
MEPARAEAILSLGARTRCTEALFTFGERPEEEPGFPAHLKRIGYSSILDYCYEMCRRSIAHGLLPHTNAGILTYDEMERLRQVNASMGLMLETTARIPAHAGSIGKEPEVRLGMMEDAGKLRIPFSTGLLLGIGETMRDRQESLSAIRDIHRRYGHIQEIIIQNFCPKPGTSMAGFRSPDSGEVSATVVMAKEILGDDIPIQVPPNLIDASSMISCGVDDLGGVSPVTIDYINPDHPWPGFEELKRIAGDRGLRERLCIYPRYIEKKWYHPDLESLITRLAQILTTGSCGL